MSSDALTIRELNRATLARQMLLCRSDSSVLGTIEHLVGMQAQAPNPPYVGLWTRLEDFQPEELSRLILDRRAVRIAVMRNTVHLVSASDCLALRPLVQPILDRGLYSTRANRAALEGLDVEALAAAGRELVEEQPHTARDLGERLLERWPDRDAAALARAIRHLLPLVQVPPRGIWGESGQTTHHGGELAGKSPEFRFFAGRDGPTLSRSVRASEHYGHTNLVGTDQAPRNGRVATTAPDLVARRIRQRNIRPARRPTTRPGHAGSASLSAGVR